MPRTKPNPRCACGAPRPLRKNKPEVQAKRAFSEEFREPDHYHHQCDECHKREQASLPPLTPAESESLRKQEMSGGQWGRMKTPELEFCFWCDRQIELGESAWCVTFWNEPGIRTCCICDDCGHGLR